MKNMNSSWAVNSFRFIFLFSVIAFVLHLAWETIQCSPFFRHTANTPNLGAMILASAGDVLMILAVYLMTAIKYRSFSWFKEQWGTSLTLSVVGFSLILAVFVEIWAIRTQRWAYTDNNPVLPILGISILPLLQMALINPISMFASKIILTSLARAKH